MRILKRHKFLKLSIILICLTVVVGLTVKGRLTHEPFDSDKWKNWELTEETWSLRWDMMNDLRQRHELVGKRKSEIVELLGEPNSSSKSEFRYQLGYSRHGINTATLTITFDTDGKVITYNVWQG